jgi:predicted  nucleic acid-binding Zn-ribbon protein
MSSDEVERLKNEIINLNLTKQRQTEQIEKLKKKIDKERKNHSQELSSVQSLKDTLQTTLAQIQELYTRYCPKPIYSNTFMQICSRKRPPKSPL